MIIATVAPPASLAAMRIFCVAPLLPQGTVPKTEGPGEIVPSGTTPDTAGQLADIQWDKPVATAERLGPWGCSSRTNCAPTFHGGDA